MHNRYLVARLALIDRIISQSTDKALDKLMPQDKARFYDILRENYHFDFNRISQKYDIFHLALKETYPLKHYKIEAKIVMTMHEDTKNGKYRLTDEVEAFSTMIKIIQEDEEKTIQGITSKLDMIDSQRKTIVSRLDSIDRKREVTQQGLVDEKLRMERLDEYLAEVHANLKQREKNDKTV